MPASSCFPTCCQRPGRPAARIASQCQLRISAAGCAKPRRPRAAYAQGSRGNPSRNRVPGGTTSALSRIVFETPEIVPVSLQRGDNSAELTFDAALRLDGPALKAALPEWVTSVQVTPGAETLKLSLGLAPGVQVNGFREDEAYAIDIVPVRSSAPNPPSRPVRRILTGFGPACHGRGWRIPRRPILRKLPAKTPEAKVTDGKVADAKLAETKPPKPSLPR